MEQGKPQPADIQPGHTLVERNHDTGRTTVSRVRMTFTSGTMTVGGRSYPIGPGYVADSPRNVPDEPAD